MTYTDLVFDLYGTLVDIHTEETDLVWEKTAIFFGFCGAHYTTEELQAAFRRILREKEAKAGQSYEMFPDIPFEEVMAQLLMEKGITENTGTLGIQAAQLFRISSIEYIKLYPHVLTALATLRERGYRLWLLSNAQAIFTAYELRHLQLDTAFDGIYLSSDYRCRKPDIRFFRALTDERKLDVGRCLFIGNDRNTDIAGAQNAGMATLYIHTQLTPPDQTPADPALLPCNCSANSRHFEYEGDNWQELTQIILDT